MLDMGGVPLYSKDRGDNYPIVIAGGPCAFNPEPLADFIDVFVIGEAEEVILEIVKVVQGAKGRERPSASLGAGRAKGAILKELAKIEGVYAPSLNSSRLVLRQAQDSLEQYRESTVEKRIVKDLDNSFFPTNIVVPYIQIVHDRIGIEIMRGCPHKCKFCQACKIFHPLRIRSVKKIMEIAEESIKSTGYEEISLLSLSSGDYPYIEELARRLQEKFKPLGVKISLPSLRVGTFEEYDSMDTLKRAGLTFAPEAGSERLRRTLNKKITDAEIIEKSGLALNSGWRKVKLYFMTGLPGEIYEDLDAIIDLAGKIRNVNLSVSPFIPKPHSDFEREGMERLDELKEKKKHLESRVMGHELRGRTKIDFHSVEMAKIEAALARGDRHIGKVILKAWQKGARLQAWTEHFNYSLWVTLRAVFGSLGEFVK